MRSNRIFWPLQSTDLSETYSYLRAKTNHKQPRLNPTKMAAIDCHSVTVQANSPLDHHPRLAANHNNCFHSNRSNPSCHLMPPSSSHHLTLKHPSSSSSKRTPHPPFSLRAGRSTPARRQASSRHPIRSATTRSKCPSTSKTPPPSINNYRVVNNQQGCCSRGRFLPLHLRRLSNSRHHLRKSLTRSEWRSCLNRSRLPSNWH